MNTGAVTSLLRACGQGAFVLGGTDHAAALEELADALEPLADKDFGEVVALLKSAKGVDSKKSKRPRLSHAVEGLRAFELALAIAAPAAAKSLLGLRRGLEVGADHGYMTIRSLIDSVSELLSMPQSHPGESLVDAYARELKDAVHDGARFPKVFSRLQTDTRLKKADIVAIASQFAFSMAKSTTKDVALRRIWSMHEASETFAAKARAMKGKSAA